MHPHIDAIFLDVGNTLRVVVKDEAFSNQARHSLVSLVGAQAPVDAFFDKLNTRWKEYRKWSFDNLTEACEQELWTRFMLPDYPFEQVAPLAGRLTRLWRDRDGRRVPRPDVKDTVLELSGRGYCLGIIANTITETEIPDWMQSDGLTPYFSSVVLSSKVRYRKPGPEIYWEATRCTGIPPERSAYVGDNPERDVVGTRKAGFGMVIILMDRDELAQNPPSGENCPDAFIHEFRALLDIFPPRSTSRAVQKVTMGAPHVLDNADAFSDLLYQKMQRINAGIPELEPYEFRYALNNLFPEPGGWSSVQLDSTAEVERRIGTREFYANVQLKPCVNGRIVLDENIVRLTNMLFVGLVTGQYSEDWINARFYFDIRGFHFLTRTVYFTPEAVAHFGGKPFRQFDKKQSQFECYQGIGYKDFQAANAEVDQFFIAGVKHLVAVKGTPILVTIAGPTAAGKTEIVTRLRDAFRQIGRQVTSIEMDNFLLDNDYRDDKGIRSLGKEGYHFELFMESLEQILRGHTIVIPRNTLGVSSHNPNGTLKLGAAPLEVDPADVIFLEGNFPFQIREVAGRIGIKIVYLTDDPIRLKRKWKRDIDYRKRYDPTYFRNRFFRTQFLRAEECYRSQIEVCDMVADTTGAAVWVTPSIARVLEAV